MAGSLDSCINNVYEPGNIPASSGTEPVRVTIVPPEPFSISGTPVTTGIEDASYAGFTVTAASGHVPYTYSIESGTLPPGITLDSSTGVVSGTPTTAGTYADIVIRATDVLGATADLDPFTIIVDEPVLLPRSAMLPGVFVNSDGTPRQANADGVMVNL